LERELNAKSDRLVALSSWGMKPNFKFTLVEIAPLDEFLWLKPEERIGRNNITANRQAEIEEFMEILYRSHNFLKSQYGNLN
jgi:hypothetical protein